MNLDNIPNNLEGMHQLHNHLQGYTSRFRSLFPFLSYSTERHSMTYDRDLTSYGSFSIDSYPERNYLQIQTMTLMDYAEILYLVAKGIQYEREGSMGVVEYVEVDKSESLYADLVKEQKDRHEAILEAVDALLASDIPADQAVAIQKIIKWREGISEKATESVLKPEDPRFRSNLDLEL